MKTITRKRKNPRTLALKEAGVTYGQIAKRADVTWRMVKFWIDGQRTSKKVESAYYELLAAAKREAVA